MAEMTKRGAKVYLTWDEYAAVCGAADEIATNCESADEDYVEKANETLAHLASIRRKFKIAKSPPLREQVIEILMKDGMSRKEASALYRKYGK